MWTVYVPMLAEQRPALELDVFGPDWFAVLEPGTVRDQGLADLAFNVTAPSFDGAREQAAIRPRELYAAAGIDGAGRSGPSCPPTSGTAVLAGRDRVHLARADVRDRRVLPAQPRARLRRRAYCRVLCRTDRCADRSRGG